MTRYRITIARSAAKEFRDLPQLSMKKIRDVIDALALEPRPEGKSKKLRASGSLWRVRVGDYRVVYSVDNVHKVVDIIHIRHRKDVYRVL
jgi:mRNA interferase RelE/StbE